MVCALSLVVVMLGTHIYFEGYLAGLIINNEVCYISHKVL